MQRLCAARRRRRRSPLRAAGCSAAVLGAAAGPWVPPACCCGALTCSRRHGPAPHKQRGPGCICAGWAAAPGCPPAAGSLPLSPPFPLQSPRAPAPENNCYENDWMFWQPHQPRPYALPRSAPASPAGCCVRPTPAPCSSTACSSSRSSPGPPTHTTTHWQVGRAHIICFWLIGGRVPRASCLPACSSSSSVAAAGRRWPGLA